MGKSVIWESVPKPLRALCLVMLLCIGPWVHAKDSVKVDSTSVEDSLALQSKIQSLEEQLRQANETIDEFRGSIKGHEKALNDFQEVISTQESAIDKYKRDLNSTVNQQQHLLESVKGVQEGILTAQQNGNMSFATWAGIVLASVAVIVTVLGVAIALLALVGYRATLAKAEEIAAAKAEETGRSEIAKHISQGTFDEIIETAVEKVAFKGIMSGQDLEGDEP